MEGVEMKGMGSGWSRQTCQLHNRVRVRVMVKVRISIRVVVRAMVLSASTCLPTECSANLQSASYPWPVVVRYDASRVVYS